MKWNLILDDFNTGQYNMDFDLELAKKCNKENVFLRFYRWKPYCISLGANQKFEDIDLEMSKQDSIDIVRRPTGGRAILHAEELTYSVCMPLNSTFSNRDIYTKISLALVQGLKLYNSKLNDVELENIQPNFPDLLNQPSGVLCFASTAKSEVKFNGKKIIGSAQRKLDTAVLQHGSILCGKFHTFLPKYLNTSEENKTILELELQDKTTEIETIIEIPTDYLKLQNCLIKGFESEWNISLL